MVRGSTSGSLGFWLLDAPGVAEGAEALVVFLAADEVAALETPGSAEGVFAGLVGSLGGTVNLATAKIFASIDILFQPLRVDPPGM